MSNGRWWFGLCRRDHCWAIGGTGVAQINLLFGSGGGWLDPLLPIVVLAAIMLIEGCVGGRGDRKTSW
ncbi:hypothetical protein KCP71_11920 [Salmonella enterica subsp. enterica]|nr:hypothetical protein KCP71_11920 [Salmonella enterica subsp. enterica]